MIKHMFDSSFGPSRAVLHDASRRDGPSSEGSEATFVDPDYGVLPAWVNDPAQPVEENIPNRLDEIEPGPFLAAILDATDISRLSGYDRICLLRAQQRMASHYNAGVYQAMAAVTDHMRQEDDDYMLATEAAAAEIRVALRLTRRATDSELSFALELRERLPRVWEALARGDIDVRRAKKIARHTIHLTVGTARNVVAEIIEDAGRLTTGQLAARLKRLCIEADPDEAADRYRRAVDDRRVVMEPTVEGTANLSGFSLPPAEAARAMRRINDLARSLRGAGETRTMDQLRSDVFLDLLNGGASGGKGSGSRGTLDMRIDLTTLARMNDKPGELAGFGPVTADVARQVAQQSHDFEWRYTVTDPVTGDIVANGTTQRRPNAKQRRFVQSRDPVCIFPGCRMPATESDIDHTVAHAEGGPTTTCNCGPLCRHDHSSKQKHCWTYHRLPNGDYQWRTRLGHTYTTSGQPP